MQIPNTNKKKKKSKMDFQNVQNVQNLRPPGRSNVFHIFICFKSVAQNASDAIHGEQARREIAKSRLENDFGAFFAYRYENNLSDAKLHAEFEYACSICVRRAGHLSRHVQVARADSEPTLRKKVTRGGQFQASVKNYQAFTSHLVKLTRGITTSPGFTMAFTRGFTRGSRGAGKTLVTFFSVQCTRCPILLYYSITSR